VTFTPTTTGSKTATLTINSNGQATPKTYALSGTGVDPIVTIAPAAVTFATQNVGTNSATQTITIRNTGTAAVTTSAVVLGGTNANQFVITNPTVTCVTGRSLAAGATCTFNLRFSPTGTSGVRTATLTFTTSTGHTVVATVSGTAATPATIAAPATLAFGRHPLNSITTTTLQVSNTGIDPLSISALTITGATSSVFTASLGTCSAPVASGGTCQLNVTFQPTAAATSAGVLTITSNASNNPRTVNLSGRAP
jgi:hypothetical protein